MGKQIGPEDREKMYLEYCDLEGDYHAKCREISKRWKISRPTCLRILKEFDPAITSAKTQVLPAEAKEIVRLMKKHNDIDKVAALTGRTGPTVRKVLKKDELNNVPKAEKLFDHKQPFC